MVNLSFSGYLSFQETLPCLLKHKHPGLLGQAGLGSLYARPHWDFKYPLPNISSLRGR